MSPQRVLIPLPSLGFDPTEAAIPWKILTHAGVEVLFATPDGQPAQADPHTLHGHRLGIWRGVLRADPRGRAAYRALSEEPAFLSPLRYEEIDPDGFDGLILPGGHAPEMRPYLESAKLQATIATFFERFLPVGAVCHGVLLVARTQRDGRSILEGRRTTALTASMENFAWFATRLWLKNHYRTYDLSVEAEVKAALAQASDFEQGPPPLLRDTPERLERGFTVRDGNYLSARWPGDAHRFANEYLKMLRE